MEELKTGTPEGEWQLMRRGPDERPTRGWTMEELKTGTPVFVNVEDEKLKAHFSSPLYIVVRYETDPRFKEDEKVCLYSVENRCYVYANHDWLVDATDIVLDSVADVMDSDDTGMTWDEFMSR